MRKLTFLLSLSLLGIFVTIGCSKKSSAPAAAGAAAASAASVTLPRVGM